MLAFLTGLAASAWGPREALLLGLGVVFLGLSLALLARETRSLRGVSPSPLGWVSGIGVVSLMGLATNLKDGLAWLALPLILAVRGFSPAEIGLVAGFYPLVWAVGQLFFGPLSDHLGRTPMALGGLALQGLGLLVLGGIPTFSGSLLAAFLLGVGTAMAYPTLIALVADRSPRERRATALGVYRFFRDAGYVLGALLAGLGNIPGVLVGTGIGLIGLALWARGRL